MKRYFKFMDKKKKIIIGLSSLTFLGIIEVVAINLKTLGPITFLILWLLSVASPWLNTNEIITQGGGHGFQIERVRIQID